MLSHKWQFYFFYLIGKKKEKKTEKKINLKNASGLGARGIVLAATT